MKFTAMQHFPYDYYSLTNMTRQKGKYGGRQTKVRRRDRDEATLKEIDYTKLKRKLRIMNNDRRNYAHEVNHILRKQG